MSRKLRRLVQAIPETPDMISVVCWALIDIGFGWLFLGLLYVAAGIIAFENPLLTSAILTLMLGWALVIGGFVRGYIAWHVRGAGKPWGWVAFSALITLLLGIGTPLSAVAALFHVINHATFKASLFMAAGIIDHECGTRDMRRINGLWRYMPYTGLLAMVAAAAARAEKAAKKKARAA